MTIFSFGSGLQAINIEKSSARKILFSFNGLILHDLLLLINLYRLFNTYQAMSFIDLKQVITFHNSWVAFLVGLQIFLSDKIVSGLVLYSSVSSHSLSFKIQYTSAFSQ